MQLEVSKLSVLTGKVVQACNISAVHTLCTLCKLSTCLEYLDDLQRSFSRCARMHWGNTAWRSISRAVHNAEAMEFLSLLIIINVILLHEH